MELKLEQQLKIQVFKQQVEGLNETEVKQKLVEIYQQMIEQQNHYRQALKKAWLGL